MQKVSNLWSLTGVPVELQKYIWHVSFSYLLLLLKIIKKSLSKLGRQKKGDHL